MVLFIGYPSSSVQLITFELFPCKDNHVAFCIVPHLKVCKGKLVYRVEGPRIDYDKVSKDW